jgi:hypothetical protein
MIEQVTKSVIISDWDGELIKFGGWVLCPLDNTHQPVRHFQSITDLLAYALVKSPIRASLIKGLSKEYGIELRFFLQNIPEPLGDPVPEDFSDDVFDSFEDEKYSEIPFRKPIFPNPKSPNWAQLPDPIDP